MYNKNFYKNQTDQSYKTAKITLDYLSEIFVPSSVVDIGCGKGTWLKAFGEQCNCATYGVEGSWLAEKDLLHRPTKFWNRDLNRHLNLNMNHRSDLAISLEVAEHLNPSSSQLFIKQLTDLSDVILFSAAQPGQGGIYHTNERLPSFWLKLFNDSAYDCFDIMRPYLSNFPEIPSWYRQNMFLYVKRNTCVYDDLILRGFKPISTGLFVDMVSTQFYLHRISLGGFLKYHLLRVLPSKVVAFLHGLLK